MGGNGDGNDDGDGNVAADGRQMKEAGHGASSSAANKLPNFRQQLKRH